MHQQSLDQAAVFRDKYLRDEPLSIAEIGSCSDSGGSYRYTFDRPHWKYTGFDLAPGGHVDILLGDAETWTVPEGHAGKYDVVLSGQTLEHVRRPWLWFPKVVEFCRSGGLIWITAPNTWEFHEFPIDCWRIWPDGMRTLFEDSGMIELECFFLPCDTYGVARKP